MYNEQEQYLNRKRDEMECDMKRKFEAMEYNLKRASVTHAAVHNDFNFNPANLKITEIVCSLIAVVSIARLLGLI